MSSDRPKKDASLHVREGVSAPGPFNPELDRFLHRPESPGLEELTVRLRQGDRVLLGKAITLIESRHPRHQQQAQQLIEQCIPFSGHSVRIGITGPPGVGKSTFIETFGKTLIEQGHRVAVLAIDPSSQLSKGSILGDKTRMQQLASMNEAFIRPSPAGASMGGVARKTRESIVLCEAAGFDVIIVETVGVGQSEIAVFSMTDYFLLLLLPGAGDELQGIKRGVVEMADGLAVNKADGENVVRARQAMAEYRAALHLFPPKESGWIPAVHLCSAVSGAGISDVWEQIQTYIGHTRENGYFEEKRRQQARYWMQESILDLLKTSFSEHPQVQAIRPALEKDVLEGRISPFAAAERLMEAFTSGNRNLF